MRHETILLLVALLGAAAGRAHAAMNVVHLSGLDLVGARIEGLKRLSFEQGLLEGAGTLESPIVEAAFKFDDLVGSWNAEVPEGASLEMQVQVRVDGTWTKWYRLGRWETPASSESPARPRGRSLGRQEDLWGHVEVDTLKLRGKADAFRYRLLLGAKGRGKPRLARVSVSYEDMSAPPPSPAPFEPGPWVREIAVPPRSQMEEQEKYKRDICSPTSLAMVLEFWGRKRETIEIAHAVQDAEEGIYGNWPLNVAAASLLRLSGHVARLSSVEELQAQIAAGRPTVISIAFGPGELSGAPMRRTRGHLLVVTGFTPQGDLIVNDPAAPDRASARRVYKRAEISKAWLAHKRGLAYLLGERFPEDLAVGVPTADLRARPAQPRRASSSDPSLVSQLLYGELVRVHEAKGDWVRVRALEQPQEEGGEGYPGWVRADALRKPPTPYRPDAVVRAKRADVFWRDSAGREQSLTLPIGALLHALPGAAEPKAAGEAHPPWDTGTAYEEARMLDGKLVRAPAGTLRNLSGSAQLRAANRRDILEVAALFLGDRYVWGGRSSLQRRAGWGVDCSGLVQLAYRSVGMNLPRDAHDQFLKAAPLKRREIQPGDLVFLSDSKDPKRVNHVMLYTGGEGLLESRESAGKTVRVTFEERFGAPLSAIESGDTVMDMTRGKPVKRRVHFGRFLPE